MAKKAAYGGPAEALLAYEALVESVGGIERKGATPPYTSLNGWMTSFLDTEGAMSLRLSAADRAEFAEAFGARVSVQHGREMKDFVVVPEVVLHDTALMATWFGRSLVWVGSLKPKSTRR